jgi:hypothetical protein
VIPTGIAASTYHVVGHLLAQHEVKVGRSARRVLKSRLELDEHAVLQEVVELGNTRVEVLRLEVLDSARTVS